MKSYVFPGEIEPGIRQIAADEIPYMRTPAFSALVKSCERRLLSLSGCNDGRAVIFTASGTGAMDAVVTNYVAALGSAVVIDGGGFGHRWVEMCQYYGIECHTINAPFGQDPDYDELEALIATHSPKALLMQHHETASGQLYDLPRVADICRRHGVSLVVDAISSFLAEPIDMDSLGIDVMITSSQKGLNIQPGLSIVLLSKRLDGFKWHHGNFYFDFDENLKNLERGQTPYSPATMLFVLLDARLEAIEREGGADTMIHRTRKRAEAFRQRASQYGWLQAAQRPAAAITGLYLPDPDGSLASRLITEGIYMMPSGRPGFFRVNHMGDSTPEEFENLADTINRLIS